MLKILLKTVEHTKKCFQLQGNSVTEVKDDDHVFLVWSEVHQTFCVAIASFDELFELPKLVGLHYSNTTVLLKI